MKKLIFYSFVILLAVGATSCKPKQSAYKAAYERAKEKEVTPETNPEQAVQPDVTVNRSVTTTPSSNISVRKEKITPVMAADASGLRRFSVVIGSFVNQTNATSLKESMQADGYKALLAQNEKQMYRVIVASFDMKEDAAAERDRIKAKYAPRFDDAWLLERQDY